MNKEQEILAMLKYFCKEVPTRHKETTPNVFDLRHATISVKEYYQDMHWSKMFIVDFTNKTVKYKEEGKKDNPFQSIDWDLFVERAYENLHQRIRTIVQNKMLEEEHRRAECALKSRIERELRWVIGAQ